MNRLWTEAEDNIIRADSAACIPRPLTAAKLGRPVHATRNRALKLHQQIQVHIAWTATEESALRAALTQEVPAPTDKELSRRFGRKISSLRAKIKELGLAGPRRHRRDGLAKSGRARLAKSERQRPADTELARLRQAQKAEIRATRAAERLAQMAEKAAAVAELRQVREEARLARANARIAAVAEKKAARLAAQTAAAAEKARRDVQREVQRKLPALPKQPVHDTQAAMARMRDAWRRVSAAPRQPSGDPAEAERRLLAMLGTR